MAPFGDEYSYDSSGNRTTAKLTRRVGGSQTVRTQTSTYPAATAARPHAVSKVETTGGPQATTEQFGYDPLGNTTTRSGGKTDQKISWDLEGHQIVVKSKTETSFAYDAYGSRLLKYDSAANTTTLYLGASEYSVTKNGVSVSATVTRNYAVGDTPVAVRDKNGIQVVVADHHNTGQVSIDPVAAGQPVTKRRTAPFGVPLDDSAPAWPGDRGYLNKTTDTSTGTTHLDAREYAPTSADSSQSIQFSTQRIRNKPTRRLPQLPSLVR